MLFKPSNAITIGRACIRPFHQNLICCSSNKSHYDVLKVKQDCTSKEIKESFIKLSKEYHPDSNNVKRSHQEFVKIVEAYNVLGKPESRRKYDLGLPLSAVKRKYNDYYYKEEEKPSQNPWDDPSFYRNRDKSRDFYYSSQPYYGIKGIKRVSNGSIVTICIIAAAVAVIMQILAIRYFTLKRDDILRRSAENEEILASIKQTAEMNGNELQIEILKERMRRDKYINYKDD